MVMEISKNHLRSLDSFILRGKYILTAWPSERDERFNKWLGELRVFIHDLGEGYYKMFTDVEKEAASTSRGVAELKVPIILNFLRPLRESLLHKSNTTKVPTNLNSKTEISIGKLTSHTDGSIRYDGNFIRMPNQQKDLCRLFMNKPEKLVTIDRIRDELIRADRRKETTFATISKYVSKLRNVLKNYYKTNVLINQQEEGWYFRPPK